MRNDETHFMSQTHRVAAAANGPLISSPMNEEESGGYHVLSAYYTAIMLTEYTCQAMDFLQNPVAGYCFYSYSPDYHYSYCYFTYFLKAKPGSGDI